MESRGLSWCQEIQIWFRWGINSSFFRILSITFYFILGFQSLPGFYLDAFIRSCLTSVSSPEPRHLEDFLQSPVNIILEEKMKEDSNNNLANFIVTTWSRHVNRVSSSVSCVGSQLQLASATIHSSSFTHQISYLRGNNAWGSRIHFQDEAVQSSLVDSLCIQDVKIDNVTSDNLLTTTETKLSSVNLILRALDNLYH